ncbi:T106A protein, partial [Urocolius indicus]|nr:T106A protein [Urocolius indicus]
MGGNLSLFSKTPDQKEILPKQSNAEGGISNYAAVDSSAESCVPCVGGAHRSYVNCPTCQGTGRIPREQEKQLVALIPYGDRRLKPRRTKLYVFLAVTICLLTTSLSIFFLFPRSIIVLPAGLNASSVAFDARTTSTYLNMTNVLNITNKNFYLVTVEHLHVEVLHQSLVVGKTTMKSLLNISPLQDGQVSSALLVFSPKEIRMTWCSSDVLLPFGGTVTYTYLSHSEQLAFEGYQYMDCRGNATLPHLLHHFLP